MLKPPSIFQKWKCVTRATWTPGMEGSETLSDPALYKGACPLCLHSSNKALSFLPPPHTHFTHTPSSPSLSHTCSFRSLDSCCASRFFENGPHCSWRDHPRRCSQLLGRGQHVAEVPCPRGAQGQEGRPARCPRCFHSHLQVLLSLSLSLEVILEGYLGREEFSWVIVAWGSEGNF